MKRTVSRLFAGLLSAAIIFSGTAGPVSAREQIGIIWQMPEEPEESEDTLEAGMPKETDRIPEDENREESGGTPGAGASEDSEDGPEAGASEDSEDGPEAGASEEPEDGPEAGTSEEPEDGPEAGTSEEPEDDFSDEDAESLEAPDTEEGDGLPGQSQEQTDGNAVMKGAVEVLITAGVPVEEDQKFQVTLNGGTDGSGYAVLSGETADEKDAPQTSVRFSLLEAGTYELQVSGSGYLTYKQTIQVDGLACRVQLYTGEAAVGTETAKPGLISGGDLNGDGTLDQSDIDLLINAVEEGRHEAAYDLYGDGKTDLLDLNYLTRMMGESHEATLEKFIPAEAAEMELQGGTIRSGTVEEFLKGEGGITLEAAAPVSKTAPLEVSFDFQKYRQAPVMEEILVKAPQNPENGISEGTVLVETEDGSTLAGRFSGPGMSKAAAVQEKEFQIERKEDGSLRIFLGGQIAVKRVTFRITKTAGGNNLAEISCVEFVNDMESRIPEPEMNIPTNVAAEPGNKSFTVHWDAQSNVTAYEIRIESEGKTDYRKTTGTSAVIQQFMNDKMTNHIPYEVSVQSLNGEWKSGYSGKVTVIPKPDGKPPAPDRVKVTGGYRCLEVRWASMKDTDSFNLYYKEDGTADFEKITGIEGTYYKIEGLKDSTKYVVYLTGTNELGEGPASLTASDTTISGLVPAKLPEYRLINTSSGEGKLSSHIVSASVGNSAVMVDSPLDTESGSALGAFDNSYASYVSRKDWDFGGAYPGEGKGVTAQLDDVYEIGMITLAQPMDEGAYSFVNVQYTDENGKWQTAQNVSMSRRSDGSRKYYLIKFKEPVRTSRIQIGVGQADGRLRSVTIAEIRFHEYDSLEHDILNLYADDLYITLREDVDASMIENLQNRLDTPDPASGEYHPDRSALQKELDAARELLETKGLGGVIQVNPNISAQNDSKISVGGLVSRQPLGVTAAAEEQIVVYVGNPGMKSGAAAKLQLVFTQQHAESDGLTRIAGLKIGRNEITVPKFSSTDVEKGGALYVQYTGSSGEDQYAVRVSGGNTYPVLNLYRVSGSDRTAKMEQYIKELQEYTANLEAAHADGHASSENSSVSAYPVYDERTCILNMTDIVTDYMMLSVPASQVMAGLGDGGVSRLSSTTQAMDDMLRLFYQHKGLAGSFADGTSDETAEYHHLPNRYLNIRYMKMFAGAFMYAAGDHIGIEWGSVPGLMGAAPVTADADGRYQSGRYFGWGIAHEIGHQINQSAYAHAEVTNNYYSVLAQAKDTNDTVRFQYPKVFEKVTSNTAGYADNVFTQLGMYWQLHLAYDRDYNYKTYGTWQEMTEHLFFARADSYARNAASAPSPGGVALNLNGGRDQNLMRLASAAAERDLTEFFTRWGMAPDDDTRAYAGQFPKETRAIYYVDDAARVYEMTQGAGQSIAGKDAVASVDLKSDDSGRVSLTIRPSVSKDMLQGYEIIRVFTEWGEERREIAGFTQGETFTDQVSFAANHIVAYEVRAVDKCMNYSSVCRAGSVKAQGSGYLDKSSWTVQTGMVSGEDTIKDATEELPCEPVKESAVSRVIDGDDATVFTGTSQNEEPYILLKLNRMEEICALGYTCASGSPIGSYRIAVSADGETYQEAAAGTFRLKDGTAKVYFHDGNGRICTYDAAYVRLTAVGQQGMPLSVAEIDLYGPSGDDVELSAEGIGILKEDYTYAQGGENYRIPKGSVLFTGTYKGNPAYNVVVLFDENGGIVGGTDSEGTLTAHQIILAPPLSEEDAMLGNVSNGIWIYWFEPGEGMSADQLPGQVRAELYRVDDALTNEGQRLVSDTAFVKVPENPGSVTLEPGVENGR